MAVRCSILSRSVRKCAGGAVAAASGNCNSITHLPPSGRVTFVSGLQLLPRRRRGGAAVARRRHRRQLGRPSLPPAASIPRDIWQIMCAAV